MGKQLVNFITCGCESSALFLKFTKPGANPRCIGDRLVWVVRKSNYLTHWATRALCKYLSCTLVMYWWPVMFMVCQTTVLYYSSDYHYSITSWQMYWNPIGPCHSYCSGYRNVLTLELFCPCLPCHSFMWYIASVQICFILFCCLFTAV
jgi:hypothetical protein